jgi:hypothetical protein
MTTPDIAALRELLEKATKGPWEHARGRGLVRALRGDLAVPLFEPLEPYADPDLEKSPTVRVGTEVVFRANSQGAQQSAALRCQHYNAALIVAAVNALPDLLSTIEGQAEEIEHMRTALSVGAWRLDTLGAMFERELDLAPLSQSLGDAAADLRQALGGPHD